MHAELVNFYVTSTFAPLTSGKMHKIAQTIPSSANGLWGVLVNSSMCVYTDEYGSIFVYPFCWIHHTIPVFILNSTRAAQKLEYTYVKFTCHQWKMYLFGWYICFYSKPIYVFRSRLWKRWIMFWKTSFINTTGRNRKPCRKPPITFSISVSLCSAYLHYIISSSYHKLKCGLYDEDWLHLFIVHWSFQDRTGQWLYIHTTIPLQHFTIKFYVSSMKYLLARWPESSRLE